MPSRNSNKRCIQSINKAAETVMQQLPDPKDPEVLDSLLPCRHRYH